MIEALPIITASEQCTHQLIMHAYDIEHLLQWLCYHHSTSYSISVQKKWHKLMITKIPDRPQPLMAHVLNWQQKGDLFTLDVSLFCLGQQSMIWHCSQYPQSQNPHWRLRVNNHTIP